MKKQEEFNKNAYKPSSKEEMIDLIIEENNQTAMEKQENHNIEEYDVLEYHMPGPDGQQLIQQDYPQGEIREIEGQGNHENLSENFNDLSEPSFTELFNWQAEDHDLGDDGHER